MTATAQTRIDLIVWDVTNEAFYVYRRGWFRRYIQTEGVTRHDNPARYNELYRMVGLMHFEFHGMDQWFYPNGKGNS